MTEIDIALSTSNQDVATADSNDSDVMNLVVCNSNTTTARTLTVTKYNGTNDRIIAVISIPANSGIALGVEAIDLIEGNFLKGTKYGPLGYFFRLKTGSKIKMKQDTGTDLYVTGHQMNF